MYSCLPLNPCIRSTLGSTFEQSLSCKLCYTLHTYLTPQRCFHTTLPLCPSALWTPLAVSCLHPWVVCCFGLIAEQHRSWVEFNSTVCDLPLWTKLWGNHFIGKTLLAAWLSRCGTLPVVQNVTIKAASGKLRCVGYSRVMPNLTWRGTSLLLSISRYSSSLFFNTEKVVEINCITTYKLDLVYTKSYLLVHPCTTSNSLSAGFTVPNTNTFSPHVFLQRRYNTHNVTESKSNSTPHEETTQVGQTCQCIPQPNQRCIWYRRICYFETTFSRSTWLFIVYSMLKTCQVQTC